MLSILTKVLRKLPQELDNQYNVITDYLASSRRYMPGEATSNKYRYYHKDHLGSVAYMTGHDLTNNEEYTYDAWGEHVETPPTTENKIRYAGGYVETFAKGTYADAIYQTGERHYLSVYGRFLQRDSMTYRLMPNPKMPLACNPYIYGENNPIMKRDLAGLSARWARGFYNSSGATFHLGTYPPSDSQMFNCDNFHGPSFDDLIDEKIIRQTSKSGKTQYFTPGEVMSGMGISPCQGTKLGQPNETCPDNTHELTPELGCALLNMCYPSPNPPDKPHPDCPQGMVPIDVGFASDPRKQNDQRTAPIFDDWGNVAYVTEEQARQFEWFKEQYHLWYKREMEKYVTGPFGAIKAIWSSKPYLACSEINANAEDVIKDLWDAFTASPWDFRWVAWIPLVKGQGLHNWLRLFVPGSGFEITIDAWGQGDKLLFKYGSMPDEIETLRITTDLGMTSIGMGRF